MIKDLVPHTAAVIHEPAKKFSFDAAPFDPIQFAKDMAETMLYHGGIGLAAPQIGVPYRVIAIASNPVLVMYNPRIVDASGVTQLLDESCLTYPGLTVKIPRSRAIKVRYTQPNGEVKTELFTDLTARIIQHEVDHIDGVTLLDRADGLRKQYAMKKWAKIAKNLPKVATPDGGKTETLTK